MSRIDTYQLRKLIPREEFDYLALTSALAGYSAPRQKIHELLKSGVITRVKKGLYVFGPDYNQAPVYPEVLANLIYGPSCLSLEYALSYHGLIPERVVELTSVTPKKDKFFDTPLGRFSYRHLAMARYPHGIEQVWLDAEHPVLMASPEKALCDYLSLNKVEKLRGATEARDFLESDLRIDPDNWGRLDRNRLAKLDKIYRNESLPWILQVL